MVLNRENPVPGASESLDGSIEKVEVRDFEPRALERVGNNGVAVVLRGDFYLAGHEIFDRMVAAAVSELQLVRMRAVCQRDHLMSETDTEYRQLAAQSPDELYDRSHVLGVAGTV